MPPLPSLAAKTFRLLFEATPHPYLVLLPDASFTIVAVNAQYLTATGTSRDAIVGRGVFEVFPDNPEDRAVSGVSDLRRSLLRVVHDRVQDVMGVQKYDIPRTGDDAQAGFETRYWSPVNSPVFDEGGNVAYIIHHVEDITDFVRSREEASRESAARIENVAARAERMEAEVMRRATEVKESNRRLQAALEELERSKADLARLNDRLQELDKAKTEFFANVSHEFRTPLTLLLGPLEDVLAQTIVPDQIELLKIAHRNALRLLKLVNALLDFSRLEVGRAHMTRQATDLSQFTAGLASNFFSLSEQAGLELIIDCPPLSRFAEIDREMWEKIVLNLVSNAFKFTFRGCIEIRLREKDGMAELTVSDTGTGIPAKELLNIFERFYRVEGAAGRSYEGSGIGLALVRDLVRLHGGNISVESEEHVGSRFIVQIPLAASHDADSPAVTTVATPTRHPLVDTYVFEAQQWLPDAMQAVKPEPTSVPSSGTRRRIVVADDNADMRSYIQRLLEGGGYEVTAVSNALAAIEQCRVTHPDLLLSDIMMPGMNGFELLQRIRADAETAVMPVILLSAQAGEDARIKGLAANADDYLIKPFPARELIARVESVIRLANIRREAEHAMRQLADEIEDLYNHAPCGYHTLDPEGKIVRMNQTELTWLGYSAEEVIGKMRFTDLLSPASRSAFEADFQRPGQQGEFHDREYELVRRDGSILPVLASASAIRDSEGHHAYSRVTLFDYSERRRVEESLRQAAAVFDNTNEAIIVTDPERHIVAVNPAFSRMTGFSQEEVIGQHPGFLHSGRHKETFYEDITSALDATGQWQGEIWNRRKSGEVFPAWENISVVRDEQGGISHYVAILSDISAIKDAEDKMAYLAHHDVLTDLPNRLLFSANLEHAIVQAKRHGKKVALFMLDLDRFKLVNDTLGHATGDRLLQIVAQRLQNCVREEDTVARLGGDEFAIVVTELTEREDVAPLANKIIQAVAQPVPLSNNKEIITSTSIGISFYPDDASLLDELVKAADAAMYRAKARGRNIYDFYSAEITTETAAHLAIQSGIRKALVQGQFELHYQPQIALQSDAIVGVEALLRWHHPTHGIVLPNDFIHIAEESGLIEAIGEWVLNAALTQAASWADEGLGPIRLAINVSGRQILYDHAAKTISMAFARHPALNKGISLEFEITESTLLSHERCADAFRRMKDLGLSIAIDDFGTGYSSLSQLKHLGVDTLKIDRAFVHNIATGNDDQAIAAAIIAMAHSLGLKVAAEGVESEEQLAFLRAQGCDEAQGFIISEAVGALEMTNMLRRHTPPRLAPALH